MIPSPPTAMPPGFMGNGSTGGPQAPNLSMGMRSPGQIQSGQLDQMATRGRTPSLKQILELAKPQFSSLLTQEIRATVDIEKIFQYAQIRRTNLYYRGKQNLVLLPSAMSGMVDYQPVSSGAGNYLSPADRSSTDQYYDAVLNWFRGDVRAFDAVLGARSPNVQAMARDQLDESVSGRVRKANQVAGYIRSHCELDNFHRELVHSLGLKGTTFSYSRYVTDSSQYGFTSIPRWDWCEIPGGEAYFQCYGCGDETSVSLAQSLAAPVDPSLPPNQQVGGIPVCRTCGRPQDPLSAITPDPIPALTQSTPFIYANGAVTTSLMGPDRVTVPFWVRSLAESPWLVSEEEVDRGALMQANPDIREQLYNEVYPMSADSSSSAGMMGRYTRDLFASPSGQFITRTNRRVTHTQVWYKSWVYEYLPNDKSGAIRELLYKAAPDGLRVQYANSKPFRLSNERLTCHWAACKPEPSETLIGDPYFEDYIQASDTVNDLVNIMIEAGERSIPKIIFDPDVVSPERIRQYADLPGEYLPAKPSASSDLSKSFFRAPAAEINPALVEFIEKYIMWVRDISGITPQIWGGGGPEPTARAAEIKKNQALMRMNSVWNNIRDFEAQTYENLAYQIATFSDGRLYTTKGGSPDSLDMIEIEGVEELSQGGWKFFAEEAMPMTPGQRRDWYMNLFQMAAANPMALQLSGLSDPANLKRWQEAVGSADWRTPGLMEREGIIALLAIMATTPPMMPPLPPPGMAPPTDQMGNPLPPPPPQPNCPIPLEQVILIYPPDLLIQVTREFITGDKGREVMKKDFQGGWTNLLAFLQTIIQATAPPPMAGGDGGPGGPGGGGSPGGGGPPSQTADQSAPQNPMSSPAPGQGPPPPPSTPQAGLSKPA